MKRYVIIEDNGKSILLLNKITKELVWLINPTWRRR